MQIFDQFLFIIFGTSESWLNISYEMAFNEVFSGCEIYCHYGNYLIRVQSVQHVNICKLINSEIVKMKLYFWLAGPITQCWIKCRYARTKSYPLSVIWPD